MNNYYNNGPEKKMFLDIETLARSGTYARGFERNSRVQEEKKEKIWGKVYHEF